MVFAPIVQLLWFLAANIFHGNKFRLMAKTTHPIPQKARTSILTHSQPTQKREKDEILPHNLTTRHPEPLLFHVLVIDHLMGTKRLGVPYFLG